MQIALKLVRKRALNEQPLEESQDVAGSKLLSSADKASETSVESEIKLGDTPADKIDHPPITDAGSSEVSLKSLPEWGIALSMVEVSVEQK